MKDLIAGSLGRLDDAGDSKMYTTPRTVYVPPEYEIETDVPSVAEFVTCSLDGRLWVWKRSRRYYVAVFRWNEETERLEFVSTTILNSETVDKRGVDWILTDKSLIRSLDNEPYISRTEYDSDDTTYSDAIEKCYSFWPELETWQEIESGQVLNIDGSPDDKWKKVAQSLITPIEFHYYSDDDIQAVIDFNPQLCYCNGQLYAKGKAHIGRAYLLPRTFNTDSDVVDFYLYISPDYMREYDPENQTFNNNDGWNKLIVAQLDDNSVGIFTPEDNDSTACKKAENGLVYKLPQGEQIDFSTNNGAIFFDGSTHSNLMLNDNRASLLYDNLNYECKGLNQWLASFGIFNAISPEFIMSSFDNGTLITYIKKDFHRELLFKKIFPLSIEKILDRQLSFGATDARNKKICQVNTTLTIHKNKPHSVCGEIYRTPIHFENIFSDYAIKFSMCTTSKMLESTPEWSIDPYLAWRTYNAWHDNDFFHFPKWLGTYPICCSAMDISNISWPATWVRPSFNATMNVEARSDNWGADFCYYVPDTNEFREFHYTWDVSAYVNKRDNENYFYFKDITIKNEVIGITFWIVKKAIDIGEIFLPGPSIPEIISDWQSIENTLSIEDIDNRTITFRELFSKALFYQKILVPYKYIPYEVRTNYYEITRSMNFHRDFFGWFHGTFVNVNSIENGIYRKALHIMDNRISLLGYFSELHPEIFDFQAEIERSKLT